MTMKHEITRADLMPIPEYGRVRKERRQSLVAAKRNRLVPLPGEPGEGAPLRAFRAYPRHPR